MAGDLARGDQAQLPKIYCHKRDINESRTFICSVYHVLRKCTRGEWAAYLHRARPGAIGHRKYLKGYDRPWSKQYREKQRGTVLGSETISLVSCHMTYKPLQADSPESWDHVCTLQSCHGAVVAPLSQVPQEGSSVVSLFSLIKLHLASHPLASSYSQVAVSLVLCAQYIHISAQTRGGPLTCYNHFIPIVGCGNERRVLIGPW